MQAARMLLAGKEDDDEDKNEDVGNEMDGLDRNGNHGDTDY